MKQFTVTIDNQNIGVRESLGEGMPIFMFHGNSGSAEGFDSIISSELGRKHAIYAIDLPGHGSSDPAIDQKATYNIEGIGRFAVKVVKYFNYPEYWLVGQSVGGHAILEAIDGFDNAKGVVLISSPPISLSRLGDAFKKDPSEGLLFKGKLTDGEVEQLAKCFSKKLDSKNFSKLKSWIKKTDAGFREKLGESLANGVIKDEVEAAQNFNKKVLLIGGEQDQFLNNSYTHMLLNTKGLNAKFRIVEGAGHLVHLEFPAKLEELLKEFCE